MTMMVIVVHMDLPVILTNFTGRRGEEGYELHAGVSAAAGRPGKLLCFQRCV